MAGEFRAFLLVFLAANAFSSHIEVDEVGDNTFAVPETSQEKMERLENEVKKLKAENENLKSATSEANRMLEITDRQSINGTLFRPNDCSDLLIAGVTRSGVYMIYPFECSCVTPIMVFCDMETDGGGWTVVLNREPGPINILSMKDHKQAGSIQWREQLNFNRSWEDYRQGFGSVEGEYYLGNENLYHLTNSKPYAMRMDMHTVSGEYRATVYSKFLVQNEENRYKLSLSGRTSESSTTYDCYYYMNNRYFTTYDRDNDNYNGNCARLRGGGFWYYDCRLYFPPTGPFNEGYMNSTCYYNSEKYQLTTLQMKVRPSLCDATYKKILSAHTCYGDTGCNS